MTSVETLTISQEGTPLKRVPPGSKADCAAQAGGPRWAALKHESLPQGRLLPEAWPETLPSISKTSASTKQKQQKQPEKRRRKRRRMPRGSPTVS
jgi:hypothetical protein